jgi:hypothetical protein
MLNQCFHSAYWHRFAATIHSPVGMNPKEYAITLHPAEQAYFANNDIAFTDKTNVDHDMLGKGLKKALYNYMHGIGLDQPLYLWFDQPVELPNLADDFIEHSIK